MLYEVPVVRAQRGQLLVALGVVVVLAGWVAAGCSPMLARRSPTDASVGVSAAVAAWLRAYERGWNEHDAKQLGGLLGLKRAEVWTLKRLFEDRRDLTVRLTDIAIHRVSPSLARASYVRSDRWVDRATGRARYSSAAYEQSFRLVEGRVRQMSLRRR